LAKSVQPATGRKPGKDDYVLHTVLSLPLGYAGGTSPFANQGRHGKFMDVAMTLTDASGNVAAETRFELAWGDGDWVKTRFVHIGKNIEARREPVPFDEVIGGYVRKAVDRGVGNLARSIGEKPATTTQRPAA
jgi:hypothetical protein